ncbi:helix-turn-helix transcriptional regulator [Nocardia sp. CDC159]|uniref:Helix-turn-helix transcriptional regulator n=1 Tax=Nocardia pulmonis TaxID=2951408 RepID=A0A9X2IZL9_9NOCA|nr:MULTISPECIES: helix-turn-helix domain-containing protein [Nocardia]MCM6777638.1 helix-turn-helix transcriptional regulator [Nocardia pulmonis]MCM6790558.1 helix-turn-helix transcriptional regulator [Nocardia sp. CDC159]
MKRTTFANWPCSVARTVDLVGDWWTPLILREAYYGTTRFDDFERGLGLSRNVLSQRLNRLVEEDMLAKVRYQDRPARYEYRLTEKGVDFFPVLAAIMRWGDRWLASESGAPVVLHHTACDHDTHAEVVCAHCREPLRHADMSARLGPGFPARWRESALALERFTE